PGTGGAHQQCKLSGPWRLSTRAAMQSAPAGPEAPGGDHPDAGHDEPGRADERRRPEALVDPGLRGEETEAMAAKFPIFMDAQSTTPCDPRVVEAMLPYFTERFGHPASRNHPFGWEAEGAVDAARARIPRLSGARDPKAGGAHSGRTDATHL